MKTYLNPRSGKMAINDPLESAAQATVHTGTATDMQMSGECSSPQPLTPCTIVIFGATGDLAARKLLPALFNLYKNEALPPNWAIVGCGRSPLDDDTFRTRVREADGSGLAGSSGDWDVFARGLYYQPLDYNDAASFKQLAAKLETVDRRRGTRGNHLFYTALPPTQYANVAGLLGASGLAGRGRSHGWSRLVVEKPFGHDLNSAIKLNQAISDYFDEGEIFRIDHFLAKETVQNLLMFRFANAIFEPVWNRRYIDHVRIRATETLGVENRAGYYEQAGVIRDMFQNHMMQLLAMIAMDPPARFDALDVRDERMKVFRSMRPMDNSLRQHNLILGQYQAGRIDGESVSGYREEPGVDPASLTPTYAHLKLFLDNWRWQGVPFFLTSGKRLARKVTEIVIQFKRVPHMMFRQVLDTAISANRLVMGIYPQEKITLTFQTKNPGAQMCLRPVTMDFHYHKNNVGDRWDAYEKVLLDCIAGDQMLFWRQDAVERTWAFFEPLLASCETCSDRAQRLNFYAAGRWGPTAADLSG